MKANRTQAEQHLAETDPHITRGEEHIIRQCDIVAKLECEGHDATQATLLLTAAG